MEPGLAAVNLLCQSDWGAADEGEHIRKIGKFSGEFARGRDYWLSRWFSVKSQPGSISWRFLEEFYYQNLTGNLHIFATVC